MKFGELNPGKYLGKVDFPGPGKLVTIKGYTQENVAMDNQPKEIKPIIHFFEMDRGMVLNPTNQQLLMAALAMTDDTDINESLGKKIVVFVDPTISFGGQIRGGLRIRAPRNPAPQAIAPPLPDPAPTHGILGKPINRPEPEPELPPENDFIPF
jgi:hypothetical protein